MNPFEFILLGLLCVSYPHKVPGGTWDNPHHFTRDEPTYTEIASKQYEKGRKIAVFEVRENGAHNGYSFVFYNFPNKAVIIPGDIAEIKYECDSYRVEKGAPLSIRALFTNSSKPKVPFIAAFHYWGNRIYHVEVPVETTRISRHAIE